jgi:hypothetical protein
MAVLAALALAAGGRPAVAAQEPVEDRGARTAVVTSTEEPIVIDGALTEAVWAAAPSVGDLIQRQPATGQPPSERTEITLLRDARFLYVGVRAYDSAPDRVLGTQMMRDGSLNNDDRVELLFDTFGDRRSGFYFATNPAGALVDGLVFANGQLNTEWDAIWNVRTVRTAEGWTAEFAIPFKSLSFPAGRDVWGFNVARTIYRKLEDDRWSGARLQTEFLQVSEAGQITNLAGLTQGIGLDLRPFLGGRWLRLGTGEHVWGRKPGLDVFYNITPNLDVTASFNTDFGETEVDARQINLTRFSLLFPEKRAFFVEGVGVFSFASTGPEVPGGIPATGADVFPFFSRQIGLLAGREVPLQAGVKLTGTIGRTDVGVLTVRTGDLRDDVRLVAAEKTFLIGRVKRNFLRQSYVGAIFTEGNPAVGQSSRTYGADVRLATANFLGSRRNVIVNAYGVRSDNEDVSGRDWSYGVSAHYPNDRYLAQVTLREIQQNFRPAVGFVQRSNVRLLRAAGSFNPRPKRFLNIQQLNHDVFFTQFTRLDNNLVESQDVYITWLDWHFNSGDNLHGILDVNPSYERLFQPFEISPGVVLLPGEYRFTRFRSFASSAARRPLQVNFTLATGSYWSGQAEQVIVGLTYRWQPRLMASVNVNQTFARLPEGHFTARIVTANANFTVSPFLSVSNLLQYDNRSRNLGLQSRLRWTLQPGNDLFISFNQGWVQEETELRTLRFRVQDSRLAAKFQYSYRF